MKSTATTQCANVCSGGGVHIRLLFFFGCLGLTEEGSYIKWFTKIKVLCYSSST